jgi:hypothetical protein
MDKIRDLRGGDYFRIDNAILERFGKDLGPAGITVYCVLAMHVNAKDGRERAFPGYRKIRQLTGLSHQTICKAIKKLTSLGLIRVEPRTAGGFNRGNVYYLLAVPDQDAQSEPPEPIREPETTASSASIGEAQRFHRGSAGASLREPEQDESNKTKFNNTPPTPQGGSDGDFRKFWEAYPKKSAEDDARRAWHRLRPGPALIEEIMAALARQRLSTEWLREDGRFIPQPAKWLEKKRWTDRPVTLGERPPTESIEDRARRQRAEVDELCGRRREPA